MSYHGDFPLLGDRDPWDPYEQAALFDAKFGGDSNPPYDTMYPTTGSTQQVAVASTSPTYGTGQSCFSEGPDSSHYAPESPVSTLSAGSSAWPSNPSVSTGIGSFPDTTAHSIVSASDAGSISLGGGPLPPHSYVGPGLSVGAALREERYVYDIVEAFCIFHIFQSDKTGKCRGLTYMTFDDWKGHVLSHFRSNSPPNYALCVFCRREFHPDPSGGTILWDSYLRHIYYDHIANEQFKVNDLQPCYKTLDYLRKIGEVLPREYSDYCAEQGFGGL